MAGLGLSHHGTDWRFLGVFLAGSSRVILHIYLLQVILLLLDESVVLVLVERLH